jgi:DNA-directed RNA polymerase subunit RPC12/RpoP
MSRLKKDHLDIVNKFQGDERKLATSLLTKYLNDYSIENISDINTLKEVIYYEIIQNRLQAKLNEFATQKTIPIQLVNVMHENSEAILKLKNSLGLFAEKEKKNEFDSLKSLKKRFQVWLKENALTRHLVCPHCSKMVLLKMKTDIWDSQKHPFFPRDKVLCSDHLMTLYKQNKLSREDIAKVLEVSPDYVSWLLNKWKTYFDIQQENKSDVV